MASNNDWIDVPVKDDWVDVEESKDKSPSITDALSAVIGTAARGATFGYGDKIAAGIEALSPNKTYEEALKEQYEKQEAREKAFPVATKISELLGSVASPINKIAAPIGAGFESLSALTKAEKAKKLIDYAKAATQGGVLMGLASEGYSKPGDESNIGKSAATGALLNTAMKASPIAATAALVGSTLSENDPSVAGGAAGIGALLDFARSKTGKSIAKPAMAKTGSALQSVESGYDKLAGKVGSALEKVTPTEIKEYFSGVFNRNGDAGNSNLVKQLEEIVDKGVLGDKFNSYKKSLETAKYIANKKVSELTPEEQVDLFQAIQDSFASRRRDAFIPSTEKISREFQNAIQKDDKLLNYPVRDFLKTKVNDSIKNDLVAIRNKLSQEHDASKVDEKLLGFWDSTGDFLNKIEQGVLSENLKPVDQFGRTKTGQFGQLRFQLEESERISPFSKDFQSESFKPVTSKEVTEARGKLGDIIVGKKAIAGAGALAGTAGILSGTPIAGLAIGAPIAARTAGVAGRILERKASEINPNAVAQQVAQSPQFLLRFASRNDALGYIAKEALNGNNSSDAIKSRSFLLSMNPEFRRMVSGGKSIQDLENQESTFPEGFVDIP